MNGKKGLIGFNKFTIILVLVYFLCGVGITYAYFAFSYENDSVIVGNVIGVNAVLDVELVVGNNEGLVPMMDEALSNAINGVGSQNGACIDSLGNLSCQVYKITLTNNGSKLQHLVGSIKLYPKVGSNNVYSNLKWRELTDTTTVKEGSIVNGMDKSVLVSGLTLDSKESKTWYVALWLSEIESDQRELDKGEFEGIVKFEVKEDIEEGVVGQMPIVNITTDVMKEEAKKDNNINFYVPSSTSGTNGIYVKNDTVEEENAIYYYRGEVDNNLIFAGFCWKIVRTTETGGLKILYNGLPSNGQCNNVGVDTIIGKGSFGTLETSPAYVGYMYSNVYAYKVKGTDTLPSGVYYGNSVSYSNGNYTLVNTINPTSAWGRLYADGLDNNHYTCFTTSSECTDGKVYYIFFTNSSSAYYLELTGGKTIETALTEMLGSDDNIENYNTISSAIKGDKDTEGTIDWWYYNNIELKGYSGYLEDTVWCNDRTIYNKSGWNPNGGTNTGGYLYMSGYAKLKGYMDISFTCNRLVDSFTVSLENGNGDLDYPVGLLTVDEVISAGAVLNETNDSYYLYNEGSYWVGTPYFFDYTRARVVYVDYDDISNYRVDTSLGIRPSVSLKKGYKFTGTGNGSKDNPYVVVTK